MDFSKLLSGAAETGLNAFTGGLGGSVVSALGSLFGGGSGSSMKDQYQYQQKLMQEQQKYNLENMAKQHEYNQGLATQQYSNQSALNQMSYDENRYLRSTAQQVGRADAEKAGLNLNFQGVGAAQSSSPASGGASVGSGSGLPSVSPGAGLERAFSVSEALQSASIAADVDLKRAQAYNLRTGGDLNKTEQERLEIVKSFTGELLGLDVKNANQDWLNKIAENKELMARIEKINSEIKTNQELVKKLQAETAVLSEEQKIKAAQALHADDYWNAEIRRISAEAGFSEQQTKDLQATLPYRIMGMSMQAALAKSEIDLNSKRAEEIGLICEGLGYENDVKKQTVGSRVRKAQNESAQAYNDARKSKADADFREAEVEANKGHLEYRAWADDIEQGTDILRKATEAGANAAKAYESVKGMSVKIENAKTHKYNADTKRYRAHQTNANSRKRVPAPRGR